MPVVALPSFAKGEISPSLYARVDTPMYKVALRTARNAIIHSYGGVSNRPGLLCICPFKYHTAALFPRIFRFHQGTTDQYVLEFGDLYMRVVRNDALVLNTATTITAATQANPVVVTAASHGLSNGDDVFINMTAGMIELNKRRFIVRNVDTNTVELEDQVSGIAVDGTAYTAYTTGGDIADVFELTTPYVQADLTTLKMVQTGNTITITHLNYAPRDLVRSAHNNWTLSVNTYAPTLAAPTNGAITSTFDSNFQVFTQGGITVEYQITAIADTDGSFEESLPLTITGNDGSDPPLNTLTWDAVAAATRYAVYRRDNGLYGLLGETELLTFEDKNLATDLTISPPSARNPFSANFPMASGYYQQRQAYGGTLAESDKTWYSQTGLRLNMSVSSPLQAADAITASLSSQDVQEIRHYVPIGGDLMIMTNAGEWRISSGPDSDFSADTIRQEPETNWGSSHQVPIVVGKTIVFVEDGDARVRALGFKLAVDGFDTNDLTILANHLLAEKGPNEFVITDWTFGQFPEPRIYMVRSDGKVLTMTFDVEQEVIAWTHWDTRGRFQTTTSLRRSVESVEDGIYFGVQRKTGLGNDANYLERLHSRKFADVRNGFFVDHGHKFDNKINIIDISNADPAVITTDGAHGFVTGDEVEIVDVDWFRALADECSDETTLPNQFNDLRFTIANEASTTFQLLSHTIPGGGACDIDLATLEYDDTMDVSAEMASGEAADFNGDGTKIFVLAEGTDIIYQYTLPVAYDVDSHSYDSVSLDINDGGNETARDFKFGDSGTKMYVYHGVNNRTVRQWDLSAAYDLTTAVESANTISNSLAPFGAIALSADGTRLYWAMSGLATRVVQYNMPTAWDLSTATVATTFFINNELNIPNAISVHADDGLTMFIAGSGRFFQYDLTDAWEISSAEYSGISVNLGLSPNRNGEIGSLLWNADCTKLFAVDQDPEVNQYGLTSPGGAAVDVGLPSTEIYNRGGEVRKTVTVITDLWCQEGLQVALLLDGNVEADQTVVNGQVTVADSRSITRAMVGLPYTCDIETLDIEAGTFPATLQGKLKKITDVMVRFHKSRMPLIGPRSDYLRQMRPREFAKLGEASRLLSGDAFPNLSPDWNTNGRIFFRMCDPLPLTILGVFPDVNPEDELE